MANKLVTSLVLAVAVAGAQLPFSADVLAAAAKEEKKKRPTQLMGPSVGKKVQKAFEFYTADDIDGALTVLLDIEAKKDYDKAVVARYIAVMYTTKGDSEKKAIEYLEQAVAPDILNEKDHGESLKLLGDLQMQVQDYKNALVNYQAWMDFTGENDAQVWLKIANAYYSLKQMDKIIVPADKAIAAFGDKHNQNPYILKVQSYFERKMYPEAVKVLETVLQLFPENKQWWQQLGMFYLMVEDNDKALATLNLAYKQGFLEKESEIKTLASLFALNQTSYKAAMLLEKHIGTGLITRDDKNLASLANFWHASQHIDKAAKYYGELAKLTNSAKHYRKQGMLLKQDEQFSASIKALNKALELGAKDVGRIQMAIAEGYFYLEKYKPAYAAIKKALKDPKTKKVAKGWESFIKDTAQRKNVTI
ncbi:tetratricopeptide repeat protein [Thalassomonas haliotis]|uniref:Tetratricopeptide repeat protein n=1 Tax=Thalassomonas haliotis TaxID=485448 RepID=A0ABY7VKR8_9GAMM|nr:tetratricopeptide repeat protein [Thalassomonas haliotis]WDE13631.1 hypothetical protein H3N35_09465 [Thalassomonas haliotis]